VPGVGLDLASATSTLGRLVCDSTGTPIPIPNPPEPEIPVTIQELMLCDGEGEILSRWQCSTPDRWIELLEFVSQKSRQLAHGLAAGQVDRLVITTPEDRTAFRVGVDYGVVARAAPGFTFPEDRRIPLPVPVRAWLKGLLPAPQVSGWGLWFPERTTLTSSFSDRHTIGVLDNGWRAVADLYNVLFAHRIPAHRIQWDFELARIYSQRRPDGLIFNLFAKRSTAPDDSLTRLLDQFAGSEFARA
jgi:hypothetical protein